MDGTPTTELYFECHVTVKPLDDSQQEDLFEQICRKYWFKPAEFLLKKTRPSGVPDAFCTARSKSYLELTQRMTELMTDLSAKGFEIWRYKIENTLLDVQLEHVKLVKKSNDKKDYEYCEQCNTGNHHICSSPVFEQAYGSCCCGKISS
jgi:hypothetical protein